MEWHTQRQRQKQSCLTSIIPARHTGTRVLTLEITLTIRTLKPAFSSKIHFSCHCIFRCTDPVCMCVSTRPASSDYLIGSHFFSSRKFLLVSICFFKAADCSQGELGVFLACKNNFPSHWYVSRDSTGYLFQAKCWGEIWACGRVPAWCRGQTWTCVSESISTFNNP